MDIRDRREHALVDGEEEIRDLGAPNRRLGQDTFEAEVRKIPNVRTCSMGEGEGVSPEEPLERYDTYRHQGEPDEGESGFPTREAGVEKAHSRNHE